MEGTQGPEVLAHIANRAFHFAFFPSGSDMAGTRNKAILAGESQKARIEAHQITFMFSHRGAETIEPQLTSTATELIKGMNVTAHESLEVLAMSKFEIHLAAMAFHQAEGIELARGAGIEQRSKVAPVDIEAFSGT